jgi:hypothetical protein
MRRRPVGALRIGHGCLQKTDFGEDNSGARRTFRAPTAWTMRGHLRHSSRQPGPTAHRGGTTSPFTGSEIGAALVASIAATPLAR